MNKENVKKEGEEKKELDTQKQKMRQLIIETDGNNINIVKNELAGGLELSAVLQTLLAKLTGPR